jgi:hypothetical protein
MKVKLLSAALAIGLLFGPASVKATPITDNFQFVDASNTVLASGSFSYLASSTGQLSYSDLTAFSINVLGQFYDLSLVNSLLSTDYSYFGYNTVSNSFVPATIDGTLGASPGILAAAYGDATFGFFINPFLTVGCAPDVCNGAVVGYSPYTGGNDIAVSVTISAVPEPSTWAMMFLGFVGVGLFARGRTRRLRPTLV